MGLCWCYISVKLQRAMPIKVSNTAMAAKMRTTIMLIANAFSHPQSKKCFTSPNQTNSIIIDAMKPVKKKPKTAPRTAPRSTIQRASVNFALSLPTKSLPEIQRTGDSKTMLTIACISRASKLIAMTFFLPSFNQLYWF